MTYRNIIASSLFAVVCCTSICPAEDPKGTAIELAGGKLVLQMPKAWKKETPKSRIVQYEFSAPADAKKSDNEEESKTARITIMGAGGSVEANIDRWYGQFEDPAKAKKDAKLKEFDAAGQKVHFVNLSGTFKDTMGAGPFSGAKPKMRENYRMLGAIIVTKELGQYFIKVTGPDETVSKLTEGFEEMLKEMESK